VTGAGVHVTGEGVGTVMVIAPPSPLGGGDGGSAGGVCAGTAVGEIVGAGVVVDPPHDGNPVTVITTAPAGNSEAAITRADCAKHASSDKAEKQ
jgi:hypothetical protein